MTRIPRKRKAKNDGTGNERKGSSPYSRRLFRYKKLHRASAFRLLRLFPGSHEDDLACEIFHSDISNPPDYEAVSYTWGSTKLTQDLHTTAGLIWVTENCLSALMGLRHVTQERILWVDAICIAQADNEEKNHQIPLMANIYARAWQVLIYLGDQDTIKDPEALFGLLRGTSYSTSPNIADFLSLPWFSRIWVLQEVAMARQAKIILGSATLEWQHLSIANIHALGQSSINLAGQVPAILQISSSDRRPLRDIASLITMARSCQSSDPRDRIYALLGLVHKRSGINLALDYTRTAKEVYTDVAIHYLKAYNCLDFLSDIGNYEVVPKVNLDPSKWFIRKDIARIQDLKAELQHTAEKLDIVYKEMVEKYGFDFLIPVKLPLTFLETLLRDLKSVVKIKVQALVDDLNAMTTTPTGYQSPLHLFDNIFRDIESLLSQKVNLCWMPKAREACRIWENRLESAEESFICTKEEIETEILQSHGTFLTPRYIFAPMFPERETTPFLEENLDLPSWVPDYRCQTQLFSFTRWRPSLFRRNIVAHFHPHTQNDLSPSLEVRAIIVERLQSKNCMPGQDIRLRHTTLELTEDLLSKSGEVAQNFERSLAKTKHGATLDNIRSFAQGRKLALTETSLAIVPASFKIGDVIAVLYGGTVPYLLRPSISNPDRFQFVGECYLHGIRGPKFAPDYVKLLGDFRESITVDAEKSEEPVEFNEFDEFEFLDFKDSVLEDGDESESLGKPKFGTPEKDRESTESKDHVPAHGEQDELPWQTIFLE